MQIIKQNLIISVGNANHYLKKKNQCVSVWLCNMCIFLFCSGYPGYSYPGGGAYPATGGPHYQSQPPVTTVGELWCPVGV